MHVLVGLAHLMALAGCGKHHEPCSGKTFDVLAVPTTFGVEHHDVLLGTVTVDAEHNIEFTPEPGVDPSEVKKLRDDLDVHRKAKAAHYEFSDRGPDGMHYSCGGSVEKGTPEYPAALRAAVYSDYYEVVNAP